MHHYPIIVESLYTEDELSAARRFGALVSRSATGAMNLCFPTRTHYRDWLSEQQQLHPERWLLPPLPEALGEMPLVA